MLVLLAFVKGTNMKSKNLKLYQRIQKSYRGIVMTIVFVIIFVVFATVMNYIDFRDQLITKEQEQLLTIAKSTSSQLEDFFIEKLSDASVLEQIIIDDYYDELTQKDLSAFIGRSLNNYLKIQNGKVFELQYYDARGQLIFDTIPFDHREQMQGIAAPVTTFDTNRNGPYVGEIFELNSGDLAIDIISAVHVSDTNVGHLRMIMRINDLYHLKISDIRIGEKGYASVKDSSGILIMHPKKMILVKMLWLLVKLNFLIMIGQS